MTDRHISLDSFVILGCMVVLVLVSVFVMLKLGDIGKGNREVLCRAVVLNTANTAHADPRIRELCGEVGVSPREGS